MPTIENAHFTRRTQPCDRDLKERFLSFVCLFIFAIRISGFILSAFSHPHPPSAGIRSRFYRHPFVLCDLRLCDKCYKCVCVPNLFCRSLCDQFTLHSRASITCIRPGTLCGDLICVCLSIVCTLCGDLICVCVPILSCRGLCGQLTFHSRVFMTWDDLP